MPIILTKKADLYELLNSCSLVITAYSSVACEALLFGTPVIIINPVSFDPMHYVREKIGAVVKTKQELKKALTSKESKNKDFLYSRYYKIDGGASKRIAALLK